MIFAVDFDGTIVKNAFPDIGEELEDAVRTIWTCRSGFRLCEMIRWLTDNGFFPDTVNTNAIPVEGFGNTKIYADIYIDDRNLGGFPGWDTVREIYLKGE